ncbi:peptide MFS transporter [Streptomyces xanthophaeus]|uniref:peptide MFS transporter n=1 Tax=Streptomyces xanthophaeus TaxID=67385 RepID=UPI0038709493|nr:peptide MFS transporter [Streptomyces xanthophaeus]WST59513.1 peptide MFS transporter [Streptomyces xanthophaeus]
MNATVDMQTQAPRGPARPTRPARHPRGLATLVLAELWERFSLYGMVAILVHFLAASRGHGGMGLHVGTAEAVEGVYMAMISLLALPGGWIADRFLGARRAVLWGGLVIMAGHALMAFPQPALIWPGLVLIVIGTGLLKPNISALVGRLYAPEDDQRRDAGYSIFYMGINLGAVIAPLVVGFLGEEVDWHLGFGAAAVGMALGLLQYVLGGRRLSAQLCEEPVVRLTPAERSRLRRSSAYGLVLTAVLITLLAAGHALSIDTITFVLTVVAVVVPAGVLFSMYRSPKVTPVEKTRLRAYVWLFLAATLFWLVYDQMGNELNLFAAQKTDLSLLGLHVPASWTQSLPSLFVILLAPLFAAFWVRGGRRMSTPLKFGLALLLTGASFVVMSGAAAIASQGVKVSLMWLVGVYVIQVMGEMCLSPVGLSVTTKLAPRAFANQMMGVWFLAAATGDAIGAQLPRLDAVIGQSMNFLWQGATVIAAGAVMVFFAKRLRVLTGESATAAPAPAPVAA